MEFPTATDLINDPVFQKHVQENIEALRTHRINRPSPPPGMRYKRDAYDRLSESFSLNKKYFLQHIESIWNKESNLPRDIRAIILHVCSVASHRTVIHYRKLEEIDNDQPS